MKVNTFKRVLVEAFSDRFPCSAAAPQCVQMSVPVSWHGSSSNQELGYRAARCLAEKLMMGTFPTLLDDQLEVSQSGKRLVGLLVTVTDLLQNGAKDRVFGHPTRIAFDSAAITRRFLHDNTNCLVVTRYGPLAKIVSHMRVPVKFSRFCYGHNNERSVNSSG